MNERGGLQGPPRILAHHFGRRESPQLIVDQGQQFIGGEGSSGFKGLKAVGDIAHKVGR